MEPNIEVRSIGQFQASDHVYAIKINQAFRAGLTGLSGFSHLQVLWWGNLVDTPAHRDRLLEKKPYTSGPGTVGVFATRSQYRPNPILVTTVEVLHLNLNEGIIDLPYTDAEDGSPILDLKPYHLYERVKDCRVPAWCQHWRAWYEDAAGFNWQKEFNFLQEG